MIDYAIMIECITPHLVALVNERTSLCTATSVSYLVCLWRSAVAGVVVALMLDHSRLVPTATMTQVDKHAYASLWDGLARSSAISSSYSSFGLLTACTISSSVSVVQPGLLLSTFGYSWMSASSIEEKPACFSSVDSRTSPIHQFTFRLFTGNELAAGLCFINLIKQPPLNSLDIVCRLLAMKPVVELQCVASEDRS